MSSVIEICNMALGNVRAKSINSLDESSIEAQTCKLRYDTARRFVLRDTNWQFAKKTAVLQLLTIEPLQWVFSYQYPGDCLNIKMVTGDFAFKDSTAEGLANRWRYVDEYIQPEFAVPYEILNVDDSKTIATDQTEAYVIYTKDVSNPTLFDDIFSTALSEYLSTLIAIPLVGADLGIKMIEVNAAKYKQSIDAAISANQNEQKAGTKRLPRQIAVRRGRGYGGRNV
jgi:hypothetical protein